ncbi:MAG: hypothetical protein WCI05_12375 [Myxococcales bacterium]
MTTRPFGQSAAIVVGLGLGLWVSLPPAQGDAKGPTIGVDEIKEGMKGYGLTVFKGTRSCGRFGPATAGSTVDKSSVNTFVYWLQRQLLLSIVRCPDIMHPLHRLLQQRVFLVGELHINHNTLVFFMSHRLLPPNCGRADIVPAVY